MSFYKLANNRIKFNLYLLAKLPAAFLSGVRVVEIDEQKSIVSVPYKWLSTNPFKSTYFACLAMAAEMSTGLLALAHTYESNPRVSMLVLGMKADFHKKAIKKTFFTCEEGPAFQKLILEAKETGEAKTIVSKSEGRDAQGILIATFFITWTFKSK